MIEDDPAVDIYYVITGVPDMVPDGGDGGISESNGYLEPLMKHYSDDPNSDNNEIAFAIDFVPYPLEAVYLTDKNFNGKSYKTTVGINAEEVLYNSVGNPLSELHVKSVSKEMYEYLTSIEEKNLRVGDPFSEPVQVYNNIENGIGIFAGFTQNEIPVVMPESEFAYPSDLVVENNGCTAPCTVSFLVIGGGDMLDYYWEFGDGNSSTEKNIDHQYINPGNYDVIFEATRVSGGGFSASFPVEIKEKN